MSFELPIKISGLPDFSAGDEMFNIRWKSENIKYNNKWEKKLTDFMQIFECSFLR